MVLSRQKAHSRTVSVDHTSSITCRYLLVFYTGTKLYYLVTAVNQMPRLLRERDSAPDRELNRNVSIA